MLTNLNSYHGLSKSKLCSKSLHEYFNPFRPPCLQLDDLREEIRNSAPPVRIDPRTGRPKHVLDGREKDRLALLNEFRGEVPAGGGSSSLTANSRGKRAPKAQLSALAQYQQRFDEVRPVHSHALSLLKRHPLSTDQGSG